MACTASRTSWPCPSGFEGNAYEAGVDHLPTTLREAAQLFSASTIAREAFGDDVVDHYLNQARIELEAYDAAVDRLGSASVVSSGSDPAP